MKIDMTGLAARRRDRGGKEDAMIMLTKHIAASRQKVIMAVGTPRDVARLKKHFTEDELQMIEFRTMREE